MAQLLTFIAIFLLPLFSIGQSSLNVTLLDNWQDNSLLTGSSDVRYNDCWGYSQNGEDYAIIGSTEGTHFFRISDDYQLELLDFIGGKYQSTLVVHRDIKIYQNYAYVVCDEGNSSLQIIDLSYLPDSVYVVTQNDSTFTRVHNLFIDQDNALMYACSITPSSGGILQGLISMQVFSLADPTNPLLLFTGPLDVNEVHDAYVRDNIAYLNCGFDGLRVYNFSSPTAPMYLQNMNLYQDQGYNHQGWLSPDGTKYVFGDETNGQRLKFCSVDPWSYQVDIENYFGTNFENNSVPHNIVLTDHYAYVAYYNEGFRIYNTIGAYPIEVAHYDTYAEESLFKMNGAWGVFVYPNSELLLVSDRQSGLYLFDFRDDLFLHQTEEEISVSPNPLISGNSITIRLNIDNVSDFYVELSTLAGAQLGCWRFTDQNFGEIPVELSGGYYFFNVIYTNYLGEQVGTVVKVNVI